MKEIWVLIWVVMTPQGDGVFDKQWGASGPFEEHTCEAMVQEMNELSARVSGSHAHVAFCRKADEDDATIIEILKWVTEHNGQITT